MFLCFILVLVMDLNLYMITCIGTTLVTLDSLEFRVGIVTLNGQIITLITKYINEITFECHTWTIEHFEPKHKSLN